MEAEQFYLLPVHIDNKKQKQVSHSLMYVKSLGKQPGSQWQVVYTNLKLHIICIQQRFV